jgi:hypothetical protein
LPRRISRKPTCGLEAGLFLNSAALSAETPFAKAEPQLGGNVGSASRLARLTGSLPEVGIGSLEWRSEDLTREHLSGISVQVDESVERVGVVLDS